MLKHSICAALTELQRKTNKIRAATIALASAPDLQPEDTSALASITKKTEGLLCDLYDLNEKIHRRSTDAAIPSAETTTQIVGHSNR